MNNQSFAVNTMFSVAATFVCFSYAWADTLVYDNKANYLDQTYSPGNDIEFGDEIFLSGGSTFTIAEFKFETYFADDSNVGNRVGANAIGNASVNLRLRLNDGAGLGPGRFAPDTQLYESGLIDLGAGFETHTITGLAIALPPGVDHLTWTAEFAGIDGGEKVGLVVYHPPLVGSSFMDFWQKNGSTWQTFLFTDGTPASFGAQASVRVPDRGSTALLLTLALASLACIRGKANWGAGVHS